MTWLLFSLLISVENPRFLHYTPEQIVYVWPGAELETRPAEVTLVTWDDLGIEEGETHTFFLPDLGEFNARVRSFVEFGLFWYKLEL